MCRSRVPPTCQLPRIFGKYGNAGEAEDQCQYAYSEHRCRPNQSPEPSVISFDREIGNFDRSIRVTIAVGHKGLLCARRGLVGNRAGRLRLSSTTLAWQRAVPVEFHARLLEGLFLSGAEALRHRGTRQFLAHPASCMPQNQR
jgi:hypothetical protein